MSPLISSPGTQAPRQPARPGARRPSALRGQGLGLLALFLVIGACAKEPAPPPREPPPEIAALEERLALAGIAVSRLEELRSLRELPECPAARFRWRIYLEAEGSFANVSLFDSSELADSCRSGFRAMALKGGEHAWERLRKDIAVQGAWMILFPPGQPAEATRQAIVRSLAGL